MDDFIARFMTTYNYWVYIALMMLGLYAIIVKRNLVKKIIGMNIVQTAIILFFISISAKRGATLPIVMHGHDGHGHAVRATEYINPLPHVLMLTAIVVAVSTLGVALAMAVKLYQQYNTLEEDEICDQMGDE
ncbi:MAG: cation:proton antiporter subunit C [Deltaproteobacteria bacterium]|nr:cation:proton antiporter subunit C [Deltaproteobacteria bacterium]MBW2138373.1 cation:proton antiporter subunit C [Deltaproteobacteria bacterium]